MESASQRAFWKVASADGGGRGSPEPDPQSQFVGGESELSIVELLFPQEAAWHFLLELAAILPESSLLYAQRGTRTRG